MMWDQPASGRLEHFDPDDHTSDRDARSSRTDRQWEHFPLAEPNECGSAALLLQAAGAFRKTGPLPSTWISSMP